MDILNDVIMIFNYIYNLNLLLDKNENNKSKVSLETGIIVSKLNIVINWLIIDIQMLLLLFSNLIPLIETDTELVYNLDNDKKLLLFHLVFDF